MNPAEPRPAPDAASREQDALLAALRAVLGPLARLAVSRGLPYAAMEETLKLSVVQAAAAANPGVPLQRGVSRITAATGINRREVTRLVELLLADDGSAAAVAPMARSLSAALYTHWMSTPAYRGSDGQPLTLPRQGPAPSFETLAQEITRDVHPRSLLDELLRLQMARLDEANDTVSLAGEGFVPSGDRARLLGFLADNVGDHLQAGVDNVLGPRKHFEQAVFADGLSAQSVQAVRALIAPQWQQLMRSLVPQLEALVAADETIPLAEQHRVRIGLFAFDDRTPDARAAAAQPGAPAAPGAPRVPLRRVRKR
jgi:hypothetical protein